MSEQMPTRKGMFLLPTMFTMANVLFGFASVVASSDRLFERAAVLIVLAAVFDGLDGKVARWAHATSAFGLELDSLADVVSFGVAPAVLLYSWGLRDLGRVGWASAFVFLICGAIRLARFNVQAPSTDSRYFVGLPIPAAAGSVAAVVFWSPNPVAAGNAQALVVALALGLGLLMVSTFRFLSFKKLDISRRRAVTTLLWVVLAIYLLAVNPQAVLLAAATLYVLSAPALRVVAAVRNLRKTPEPEGEDRQDG